MSHNILLVDDTEPLLLSMKMLLESFGYSVVTATGGVEGLRKMRSGDFDAVLLDYRMPDLNGLEVIVESKKRPETERGSNNCANRERFAW